MLKRLDFALFAGAAVVVLVGSAMVAGGIQRDANDRAQRAEHQLELSKRATATVIAESTKQHAADVARYATLQRRFTQLEDNFAIYKKDHPDVVARPVRASRSRRLSTPTVHTVGDVFDWAHSVRGIKTANCESADLQHWPYSDGTRYLGGYKGIHLRDPNGHFGKWQFAPSTWESVGGTGNPADATEAEQDMRANLLYAQSKKETGSGEQPWSCARKV